MALSSSQLLNTKTKWQRHSLCFLFSIILTCNPSASSVAFAFISKFDSPHHLHGHHDLEVRPVQYPNWPPSVQPCPTVKSPHRSQSELGQDTYKLDRVTFLARKFQYHSWNTIQIFASDFMSSLYLPLWIHLPCYASLFCSISQAFMLIDTPNSFLHQNTFFFCGSLCLQLSPLKPFDDSSTLFVHFLAQILPL